MAVVHRLIVVVIVLSAVLSSSAAPPPDCSAVGEGNYPDEDDCGKYYRCEDGDEGEAASQDCTFGLFFNSETLECDWPIAVSCELTTDQIESLRLPEPAYIYYTVDDFPSYNYGSDHTLDALLEADVKTTFFDIHEVLTWGDVDYRAGAIVRALLEGHKIGDHSYDHMAHNNEDGGGEYDDVDVDFEYFGQMNLDPLLQVMDTYGFPQSDKDAVSDFFLQWIRMPNDNNWRIDDSVRDDCPTCAYTPTSALSGMQLADKLQEEAGAHVVGWDLPFFTDYAEHRYAVSANKMLMCVLSWPSRRAGKLVVLDHTFMHDFDEEHGIENYDTLVEFFRLAKIVGFEFKTLDTYLTD